MQRVSIYEIYDVLYWQKPNKLSISDIRASLIVRGTPVNLVTWQNIYDTIKLYKGYAICIDTYSKPHRYYVNPFVRSPLNKERDD